MAFPVVVRRVETRADARTFLKFPWLLYQNDPCWVPPLVSAQRYKLDRRRSPTWKHMEGEYFIAWRGIQPVGTVAAFINHRHNNFHNERAGFFGQFEVCNDQEAASALLETAAKTMQARGCTTLRGPANFSINDEYGVLIKGFDDPPVLVMPYNPPYYQRLIENTPGFDPSMNLYSYTITLHDSEASGKLEQTFRVVRRNSGRRGITVRTLDRKHIDQDLHIIKEIYNSIWDNNWGFVPLSDKELDWMIRDMKRYLDPRLVIFADVKGDPAGFLMAFPDLNQPLHAAYPHPGKPDLLSKAQILWHWKLRSKITRIRIPLMGVKSEYRGTGVEAAMFLELYERGVEIGAEMGWEYAEAGWVLEANQPMQRLVEAYNAEPDKQYRFYERKLSPTPQAGYAFESLAADAAVVHVPRRVLAQRKLSGQSSRLRKNISKRVKPKLTLPEMSQKVSRRGRQQAVLLRKRLFSREVSLPRALRKRDGDD